MRIQGDVCSAGDGQLPYGGGGMGVRLVCERGGKDAAEGSTTSTSKDTETPRAARPGARGAQWGSKFVCLASVPAGAVGTAGPGRVSFLQAQDGTGLR